MTFFFIVTKLNPYLKFIELFNIEKINKFYLHLQILWITNYKSLLILVKFQKSYHVFKYPIYSKILLIHLHNFL